MIDKRIFLVVAVAVLLVFASLFPLESAVFGLGVGVGALLMVILEPVIARWVLARKKRNLVKLREDVKRLEAEVDGK